MVRLLGFLVLYDVSLRGSSYQTDHSNSTLGGTGLLFTSIIHTSLGKWHAYSHIFILLAPRLWSKESNSFHKPEINHR